MTVADGSPVGHAPPRSYVLRRSHFSAAQRDAYARLMPRFGVDPGQGRIDPRALFGRDAPLVVDIGFGMGDATALLAERHFDVDFLGFEVHTPGIGALLRRIESAGLGNLRIVEGDAAVLLPQLLPPGSLDGIHLFFPDPWPKKRHHKRRLVDSHFLTKIFYLLKVPGYVYCITDWPDYAAGIATAFEQSPFGRPVPASCLHPRVEKPFGSMIKGRPTTKFEHRGLALGHPVTEWIGQKVDGESQDRQASGKKTPAA